MGPFGPHTTQFGQNGGGEHMFPPHTLLRLLCNAPCCRIARKQEKYLLGDNNETHQTNSPLRTPSAVLRPVASIPLVRGVFTPSSCPSLCSPTAGPPRPLLRLPPKGQEDTCSSPPWVSTTSPSWAPPSFRQPRADPLPQSPPA